MFRRREFLELMAITTAVGVLRPRRLFAEEETTAETDEETASGLLLEPIAQPGDILNEKSERFGPQSTGLSFIPFHGKTDEGLLWVSHGELTAPHVRAGRRGNRCHRDTVDQQSLEVGGSIVHVRFEDGKWKAVAKSTHNRRITAQTPIPFVAEKPVSGGFVSMGSVGTSAAFPSPWKTFFVCEDNYADYYGEVRFDGKKRSVIHATNGDLRWSDCFPRPPEHYGWLMDVDPVSGAVKKWTAPGRFPKSALAYTLTADGRPVLYMTEPGGFLYKFVSDSPSFLAKGRLFAAEFQKGLWLEMDRESNPKLAKAFADPVDLLIRASEAAKIAGATRLESATGLAAQSDSGAVFIAVSRWKQKSSGAVLKLTEGDRDASKSKSFACDDAFSEVQGHLNNPLSPMFDTHGNFWILSQTAKPHVENTGLFVLRNGSKSFEQVEIESTIPLKAAGLAVAPDGKTLFLALKSADSKNPATVVALSEASSAAKSDKNKTR